MYDLLIKHGAIIDGTGKPGYQGDLGIIGDRIVTVSESITEESNRTIEARGNVVAPGFIDIHSHSDLALLMENKVLPKLEQGITTEIVGNCGLSVAPLNPTQKDSLKMYVSSNLGNIDDWAWVSLQDYYNYSRKRGLIQNMGALVAHGSLRIAAMGFEDRKPTPPEMEMMKSLLEKSLKEGGVGLSSGLIYTPGCYAEFQELKELCEVAVKYNVPYVSHIRNESNMVVESVKEALRLGEETGIAINISHHKICGKNNWGKATQTLALMAEKRRMGVRVTIDQYPYLAGSTMLMALLPQWATAGGIEKALSRLMDKSIRFRIKHDMEEGIPGWDAISKEAGWENVLINSLPVLKEFEGRNIQEIAVEVKKEPAEVVFDILKATKGAGTIVIFQQCQEDWETIFKSEYCSIGSDALLVGEKPHPRSFGTFPRILGQMVRRQKLISIEEAIRKMTSLPASVFRLKEIGVVKVGNYADLVIFDPKMIGHSGTFMDPTKKPDGIRYVLISGKVAIDQGRTLPIRAGRIVNC